MGEYEDRYPDAYGNGEVIEEDRHFEADRPETRPAPQHRERVARAFVVRPPQDIRNEVVEQLNASPFIDATGIAVTLDGSEVTLDGTINSLMAISLAQALVSNVAGVSRVQVHLRVQPAPRTYETAATPVYKIAE